MSGLDAALTAPAWDYVAIVAMAIATYLCRASGVIFMARVRVTARVERALRALPGSIVCATIIPVAVDAGLPAILGLGAAIATMAFTRFELAALLAGLSAVAASRALGL